jgi:hypothetical protein
MIMGNSRVGSEIKEELEAISLISDAREGGNSYINTCRSAKLTTNAGLLSLLNRPAKMATAYPEDDQQLAE